MKQEILSYLEVKNSSRAKQVKLRYRKGLFTVVVPEGVDVDVEELVESNLEWFEPYIEEARRYREQVPDREFVEGERVSVLGEDREIIIEKRRSNEVKENIFLAEHLVERTGLKDQLEKALRDFAREKFEKKASKYVKEVEGHFEKIFIRDQKTRWGSCSSKDNLNFNWRLVLGPEKVLDYVVVHELVHLEVKNHSNEFEKKVREILPRASQAQSWLNNYSAKLVFEPR